MEWVAHHEVHVAAGHHDDVAVVAVAVVVGAGHVVAPADGAGDVQGRHEEADEAELHVCPVAVGWGETHHVAPQVVVPHCWVEACSWVGLLDP